MPNTTAILATLALLIFVWLSIASSIAAIRLDYWPLLIFSIGQLFTAGYFLAWLLTAPSIAVNPIYIPGIVIGSLCDVIFAYGFSGWKALAQRNITVWRIFLLG
jgi:hypothetical protein